MVNKRFIVESITGCWVYTRSMPHIEGMLPLVLCYLRPPPLLRLPPLDELPLRNEPELEELLRDDEIVALDELDERLVDELER